MKLLELFCGTKSISKVFKERNHEVFTVDIDRQFNPDLCKDILDLNAKDLPKEWQNPEIIWASPPCTTFSVSSISHYWSSNKPNNYKTYIGLAIAKKTFELIEEIKPKYWFVENPRGLLRKQHFTQNYIRKTVTYCQYGDIRMKPTDIWTNCIEWIPRKICKNGFNCHESSPRGSGGGTQGLKNNIERGAIPRDLAIEIAQVCEDKQKIKQMILK